MSPAQMSKILLKIDGRTKQTEADVSWLKHQQNTGSFENSNLHEINDSLPSMPSKEWTEVLKLENSISSRKNKSVKEAFVSLILYSYQSAKT